MLHTKTNTFTIASNFAQEQLQIKPSRFLSFGWRNYCYGCLFRDINFSIFNETFIQCFYDCHLQIKILYRCFPLQLLVIFVTGPSLHYLEGNSLECSIRLLSATHHALFFDLHPSMPDGVHGLLLLLFANYVML